VRFAASEALRPARGPDKGNEIMTTKLDGWTRRGFIAALGGGATLAAAGSLTPAFAQAKPKIALVMSGSISDGGWNQLAYTGLKELGDSGDFEVAYAESVAQARVTDAVRGYADDGYDLIIGHGFEFGSTMLEVAPEYPDQKFFATTTQPSETVTDNLLFIDPAYVEAAFAGGALAALLSKDKKAVGFVGGGDNPTQQRMSRAFVKGAEETVDGIKGLSIVTGDYNNAAKGKEAALTMIGNGADVIWHAADVTGLGAIQGASGAGATVIGCYADQTELAPDHMATSIVMNLAGMVKTLGKEIKDGTFAGGKEWRPTVKELWYFSYGGDADHNGALVSDETWGKFEMIVDDIASGAIDVRTLVP
jgi:basic membrane protein A